MQEVAIQRNEVSSTPKPEARLRAWNALDVQAAADAVLSCNGSMEWALALAAKRPLVTPEDLIAASEEVWAKLPAGAWQQAFDSHPRIGEAKAPAATQQSIAWSRGEQAAANPDDTARVALRDGNQAYEAKFGRTFIVCATGKSAAEILAILTRRLENDSRAEWIAAAEEQRKITELRLRKWLHVEPAMATPLGGA